jgi:chloramphenicol O-acetyltransferase type A
MKKQIDIENWVRKDHFKFFSQFEEPFFGITVSVDCTRAYDYCKSNGHSFFLYYLYQSLRAVNETENFRYRIINGEVYEYEEINASPTINRADGTFGFSYIPWKENFEEFLVSANQEIEKVRAEKGLIPALSGENVIHYSSIPWLKFTSITHARAFSYPDSIPKITFGKASVDNGKMQMPVSIHGHHGLMDGYHVALYVEKFQKYLDSQ